MILTTAATLLAVGFVAVAFGYLFGHYEVAVIGGILILGVGAVITGGSLEQSVGEIETETQVDGENVTETETVTEPIETPQRLPLGALVMLLGGIFVLRSFTEFSKE